jgi:ADP-heptose:LPS heptosyltransferase
LASVYVGTAVDAAVGDELARGARAPAVNLAGRTTLSQTLALFRHAAVAITVDSGPMHLAAAAGVPVVALFGPGDPGQSGPWTGSARVVDVGAPCKCLRPECAYTNGPGRCMRAIDSTMVLDAVRGILSRQERGCPTPHDLRNLDRPLGIHSAT